jgi:hypothetical protein
LHVIEPRKEDLGWRDTSAALNTPDSGDSIAVAFLPRDQAPALLFEGSFYLVQVGVAHALFLHVTLQISDPAPPTFNC